MEEEQTVPNFLKNYKSELLSDDVQGYYAGDSAYSGV